MASSLPVRSFEERRIFLPHALFQLQMILLIRKYDTQTTQKNPLEEYMSLIFLGEIAGKKNKKTGTIMRKFEERANIFVGIRVASNYYTTLKKEWQLFVTS